MYVSIAIASTMFPFAIPFMRDTSYKVVHKLTEYKNEFPIKVL